MRRLTKLNIWIASEGPKELRWAVAFLILILFIWVMTMYHHWIGAGR